MVSVGLVGAAPAELVLAYRFGVDVAVVEEQPARMLRAILGRWATRAARSTGWNARRFIVVVVVNVHGRNFATRNGLSKRGTHGNILPQREFSGVTAQPRAAYSLLIDPDDVGGYEFAGCYPRGH